MGEFSMGDVIGPRAGVIAAKDLKVCFNFLVYLFSLSVRLGMVSCEEGEVILQEFLEFLSKRGCKLGTMVRYDFVIEAKVEIHFVKKKSGNSFSGN